MDQSYMDKPSIIGDNARTSAPRKTNLLFAAGLILILVALIGFGVPFFITNFSLRRSLPLLAGLSLVYFTIVNKDPIRFYLYFFVFILPVFIALYFTELPSDMPSHPGLINYPAIYAHDIPFWALVVLLMLNVLMKRQSKIYFPKLLIPLVLYLIPAFLSTFDAKVPSLGYFELMRTLKMIAVVVLIANVITKRKHLFICLAIIFGGIIIQDVISVFQFFFPDAAVEVMDSVGVYPNIINAIPDDPESAARVCGTTGYCNALAGYFELTLPIFIAILLFAPVRLWVRFAIVTLIVLTVPIFYLTYSRGGFLGVAVSLTVLLFMLISRLSKHLRNLFLIMMILLIFASVVVYALNIVSSQRAEETGGLFTDKVRVALVNTAVAMIKDKPILGIGLNNFPERLNQYDNSGIQYELPYPVHNTYLLAAAETGIIAALLLMWFFWRSLQTAFRATKVKDATLRAIAIGILAGFCGWLTHNIVAPLYQNWIVNRITLMFLIGVAFAIPRLVKNLPQKTENPNSALPDESA
jgi:putative inorganic carbon (hco3(-)) transporter